MRHAAIDGHADTIERYLADPSGFFGTGRLGHLDSARLRETGQNVQVTVLSTDPQRRRISLSIKQAQANPWSGAEGRFPPNSEVIGKISRIAEFGAFVELEPGIEGLMHVSELSEERVRRVEDVVQVGQTVRVRVLETSENARRMSLTMKNVLQEKDLACIENVLMVGGGKGKARAARAILLHGGRHVFITDEAVASELLKK